MSLHGQCLRRSSLYTTRVTRGSGQFDKCPVNGIPILYHSPTPRGEGEAFQKTREAVSGKEKCPGQRYPVRPLHSLPRGAMSICHFYTALRRHICPFSFKDILLYPRQIQGQIRAFYPRCSLDLHHKKNYVLLPVKIVCAKILLSVLIALAICCFSFNVLVSWEGCKHIFFIKPVKKGSGLSAAGLFALKS